MSSHQRSADGSPLAGRGFIASAVLMTLIIVAGAAFSAVIVMRDGDGKQDPASTAAASPHELPSPPSAPPSEADGSQSVCGLEGEVLGTADLVEAPAVDSWDYQGTMAYPLSAAYGPGATDPAGVRYCFQHSPEGAVYAAANAAVQGSGTDEAAVVAWLGYFLADTPERETLMSQDEAGGTGGGSPQGTRLEIAGFRFMSYDGATATVDIALTGSVNGQAVNLSAVYHLTWEAGDWKLAVNDPSAPINFARLPHVAGYTPWRA